MSYLMRTVLPQPSSPFRKPVNFVYIPTKIFAMV